MDYKVRVLPTREALSRVHQQQKLKDTISGVDLVLNLITTADLIRSNIYSRLEEQYQISEGKFILLMSLYAEGETTSSDLALRIGVASATVSIMVKRMLNANQPLIVTHSNQLDGRSRLISLSDEGYNLIQTILPEHYDNIRVFSDVLDDSEKESLIIMLKKLLRKS